MHSKALLLEALKQFTAQKEQCHIELTQEINISDLKVKQFYYLELINRYDHITFGRFAEILQITRPSVTQIVTQLIELDTVYKEQCARDGRIFYVRLSEKGKKIVQFKNLELERLADKIVRSLSEDEIYTFVNFIQKIANTV